MATTPRDRLDNELGKVTDGPLADRLATYADALDTDNRRVTATDGEDDPYDCQPRTVEAYHRAVRIAAESLDLEAADADAINDRLHDLADTREDATMVTYQAALRAFYHVHDDLGVDPDALVTFNPDHNPRHDEQDMFTEDEVFALRKAVMRTANPIRNRALFELLVYTGQRIRAIVTLRYGDVDTDAGAFYLNDQVDGLKGALQRGRKRPLLGARKYVRDWLDAHPNGEGWLFVGNPNHWKTASGDHLAEPTVDQILRRVAADAGVDKPVNAHAFRHYTATVLRRDYDLGWDRIGALFGVVEGSTMPETTYSHIDDGRLLDDVAVATGHAESESNRLAPPVCPTCGEVLKAHWRSCPACREVFAPDAATIDEQLGAEAVGSERALESMVAEALRRLGHSGGHGDPPS